MKKVFKFFAALASLAAVAGGAYLVYKNFFAKEEDDFDFDDSFGDEDDLVCVFFIQCRCDHCDLFGRKAGISNGDLINVEQVSCIKSFCTIKIEKNILDFFTFAVHGRPFNKSC